MVTKRKQGKSLELFKAKRCEWLEHFSGDDENSISNQLHDLLWITAIFRVINESRSFAEQPDGSYANNGMVHNFIDKCFYEYQFISIRRLLDPDARETTCSLYALISNMEKNCHLITRYNYFKAHDVEYDVEKVRKKYEEFVAQQMSNGNNSWRVPSHLWHEQVEPKHTVFDMLSNTESAKRRPTDTVQPLFFERLRNKLDELEDIKTYAHKFIAHLERPDDRRKNDVDEINITFYKLWEAHEVICKVAILIGKLFLDGIPKLLGITQFDQFKNIDKPFVEIGNVPKLRQVWDQYLEETKSWAYFDIEDYDDFVEDAGN